jgi:DNA-binding transcriptional ArsR family regulator
MNRVFKALADPTRRRVLELLKNGPLPAGEISAQFDVAQPTMSAHLAILREADLVEAEKQGRMILYRLKISVLEDALLTFTRTLGIDMPGRKHSSKRRRKG